MKTKIPLITIGLDLGDKKHAICVLNQDGDIIDERMMTTRERGQLLAGGGRLHAGSVYDRAYFGSHDQGY